MRALQKAPATNRANVFRRFLVPSDGSEAAEAAVSPAMDLVHRTHATLDVVMVRERAPTSAPAPGSDGDDDERAGSYLAALSSRILASDGIRPRFALLKGDPAPSIHAYVHVHDIDLVAIGVRGHGYETGGNNITHSGLGRVAEALADTIDVPLLLVPPGAKVRPIDRVCIAVDGSPQATAALAAAGVLLFQSAHATLLNVRPQSGAEVSSRAPAPDRDLGRLAEDVRGAWRTVASLDLTGPTASDQILGALDRGECGMLVVSAALGAGMTPRPGIQPLVRDILEHAELPVLVFPAPARASDPVRDVPASDPPIVRLN